MRELEAEIAKTASQTEKLLSELLHRTDSDYSRVWEAMRYSACSGGKRIRAFLCTETAHVFGGNEQTALVFAAATEMVHAYSLIHDDLPCMDDSDMRRMKPSNHKVFGEATAVLAGDGLLTEAFRVITEPHFIDPQKKANAVLILSQAAGADGMIAGQIMDMRAETEKPDLAKLKKLQSLKTGALIEASVRLGLLSSENHTEAEEQAMREYARALGLAFQIKDDILDATGSADTLGKPVGSDTENGKTTFLSYYSPASAAEYAKSVTDRGVNAVSSIRGTELLCSMAYKLLNRNK